MLSNKTALVITHGDAVSVVHRPSIKPSFGFLGLTSTASIERAQRQKQRTTLLPALRDSIAMVDASLKKFFRPCGSSLTLDLESTSAARLRSSRRLEGVKQRLACFSPNDEKSRRSDMELAIKKCVEQCNRAEPLTVLYTLAEEGALDSPMALPSGCL
ncbi:hypothetical protein FA10DRAFT_266866 [Acaromyces ingoldii]|uniref:Uncharacterized protein n=1 Tax=Acaromyces ingoldii TaxID=215250 RepID=A0A316YMF5_9BASI|nr:hypothetical protein FA10DRAFT_266866 [Acaromyces ingoldii]PWN90381.1 hypothetical protein FA10DRAFT_266866 [Acaromyces ingoldii]